MPDNGMIRPPFTILVDSREKLPYTFQKELARLASFECAAVVIEAGWDEIPRRPPEWSKLAPKVVFRSILAWQQRYPTIHWWCVQRRRLAEVLTFRILSKYWGHRHERA